jgi:hypothetical protein
MVGFTFRTTTTTAPAVIMQILRMTIVMTIAVSLILTTNVHAANGNVVHVEAVIDDDLAGCTLFVAPSIIPNAGLGLFTTEAYDQDSKLHLLMADIAIPYGLPENGSSDSDTARDRRLGGLKRYDWESVTADIEQHKYMPYHEGDNIFEFWPGFGSMCNSEHHYQNVLNGDGPDPHDDKDETPVVDQYERAHPGTGAFTPFHHRYAEALQDIAAGAELFNSYGDGFFLNKKDNPYAFVPLDDDYDEAKELMTRFIMNNIANITNKEEENTPSDSDNTSIMIEQDSNSLTRKLDPPQLNMQQRLQRSWDQVVEAAPLRVQTALPKNATRMLLDHQTNGNGLEFSLGRNQRPLEWIRREGICVDRVRIGASHIMEAGRGVFAKHRIAASTIIVPVPVIQVNRTMQQITHHHHNNDPSSSSSRNMNMPLERMIVNYCLGHHESTLLLCPYLTTVSLINHSNDPAKVNAKLTLSHSKYANQTLWDESSSSSSTAQDLLESKRAEKSLGIIFNVVATRDIRAEEEIYINYGPSWQQAWDDHKQAWSPFVQDLPIDGTNRSSPSDDTDTDNDGVTGRLDETSIVHDFNNNCTVDYHHGDGADDADDTSDVHMPDCVTSKIYEIMQQSPEERHSRTPPTGCYYYPDWDADTVLDYEVALEMQQEQGENHNKEVSALDFGQALPWQFEVSGWSDDDEDDDDEDPVVTGTVGGLYPCHVLASEQAAKTKNDNHDTTEEEEVSDTLYYTVLVLLDHDIMFTNGIDYDEDDNEHENEQAKLLLTTTRRQVQLVKNVPSWALRGITQAWRNQGPVDHFTGSDSDTDHHEEEEGGQQVPMRSSLTPAPFRHYIGVDDDVFPDAWKDLRAP